MNISLDEARKSLKVAFDKFDTNKNGALDPEEAVNVLKEIGVSATKENIKAFFAKIDTDHDGQISFEELYAWFLTSEKGESEEFVAFRLMLLNKIQKQHEEILKNKAESGDFLDHFIDISVGKVTNPKTSIEVRSSMGKEAKAKLEKYGNGLEVGRIPLFIRVGCTNPEETKGKLLEVFQGFIQMASAMKVGGGKFNFDNLKLTANQDETGVIFSVAYGDPMLELVANTMEASVNAVIPETDDVVLGKFGFYFNNDFEDIFKGEVEGEGRFPALYALDGFQIKVDAKYPKSFNRAVQQASMKQMAALQQAQGGMAMPFNPILNMVQTFSTELEKYEIDLHFHGTETVDYSKLLPPIAIIKGAISQIPFQEEMLLALPGLADLVSIAENNLNTDITFGVGLGAIFLEWQLKSNGVKKFWDYIKNKDKQ